MRFFFDNTLSPRLTKAVIALEEPRLEIFHLKDRFAADTADETWISKLAEEGGWVIVSGDVRITKSPHLKEIWRTSRLTSFFLKGQWSRANLWDYAWMFLRWWPDIRNFAEKSKPGSGYLVPFGSKGKIEPFGILR